MDVMGAMSIILPVFTGATPRWRCDDSLTLNSTGESPLVTSQDNLTWETCTPEGVQCHHFTYNDSFSSIVSEVSFNPQIAKLNNLNFHPLEVVSRYRDPQLQVGDNYSYLFNLRPNI